MEDHLSTTASCTLEESDWDDDFVEDMDLDENDMTDQEDMTDHDNKSSLGTDLATWASQFQVKNNAVDYLRSFRNTTTQTFHPLPVHC